MTKSKFNQILATITLDHVSVYLDDEQIKLLKLVAKGKKTYAENWQPQVRLNGGDVELYVSSDLNRVGYLQAAKANYAATGAHGVDWCLDFAKLADAVACLLSCWQSVVDEYNLEVE